MIKLLYGLVVILVLMVSKEAFSFGPEEYIPIINQVKEQTYIIPEIAQLNEEEKDQVLCLSLNIIYETMPHDMKDAIASSFTVFNRQKSGIYPIEQDRPDTYCGLIFEPYQYSWTRTRNDFMPSNEKIWIKAQQIAFILNDREKYGISDPILGMMHYVRRDVINAPNVKKWASKRILDTQISEHVYMKIFGKTKYSNREAKTMINDRLNSSVYKVRKASKQLFINDSKPTEVLVLARE